MTNEEDHDEELYWGIVNSIINDREVCIHPYLRHVDSEQSFKLKKNHDELVSDCLFLEELRDAIEKAPIESILFHLDGRNDFAAWVSKVIGDWELGRDLEYVKPSDTVDLRSGLLHILNSRIKDLKTSSVNLIYG